jgi:hypothetical protein
MSAALRRLSSFIVFRHVLSLVTFKQDGVWHHFVFRHVLSLVTFKQDGVWRHFVFRHVLSLVTFKQDGVWRHFVFSRCEMESKTGITGHVDGV